MSWFRVFALRYFVVNFKIKKMETITNKTVKTVKNNINTLEESMVRMNKLQDRQKRLLNRLRTMNGKQPIN